MVTNNILHGIKWQHVRLDRVIASADADNEIRPDCFADCSKQVYRKPHSFLERTAIRIVSSICKGRPELLDNCVVSSHQFASVESCLLCASSSPRERVDYLDNLIVRYCDAAVVVMHGRHTGRRPVRCERVIPVSVRSNMVQLLNHHGFILMAAVCDFAKVRNYAVVSLTKISASQDGCTMNWNGFYHNHGCSPNRSFQVIAMVTFHWESVNCHVGSMRAKIQSMLERLVSQGERTEKMFKARLPGCF